ncbi:MAG: glycosyl hydrolase family 18 protein [Prolixibacteraceae bacterium]|jgi:spore germination protein YaaH
MAILVLSTAFLFCHEASAQKIFKVVPENQVKAVKPDSAAKKTGNIEITPSTVLLTDTLKFDAKTQGILNKILQPIKFKANRNRTEQKRIYDFMLDLIKNKQMNIDSATVNEIMIQLDTINLSSLTNKKSIEDIIIANNLYKKTSKVVVDSLKTLMSAVIQETESSNSQEKRDLKTKVSDDLKKIRSIQYSRASGLAIRDTIVRRDTVKKIDTTFYREISIEPKIKIIGWYNQWMKDQYLNFNFNYLSAINLYGYELKATGECGNSNDLAAFAKPGGIIKTAQNNSCDVYLTVFSKMPSVVSKFLNSQSAQNTLIQKIDSLIATNQLNGINIYFDYVKTVDADKFVQFIANLRQNLKGIDAAIRLNVTIPAISDDNSLAHISAYKFSLLNPLVDYYQVLTDQIIDPGLGLAQSASPLFSSDKFGSRSIEQTMGFYSNGKIPSAKLILTVSYSGLEWQVKDFSGELKSTIYQDTPYNDIVKNYLTQKVSGRTVIEGFDPDQVSAYLNVVGKDQAKKNQIWYDDFRSLYLKYNWALENGLGGVSIRGLGYDDGYSELWNALGAALIKIDTVVVDVKVVKRDSLKKLSLTDYLNIFIEDFKWAVAADLEYQDQKTNTRCDCLYNEDSIRKYRNSPVLWYEWQPYNSQTANKDNGNILESSLRCKCLFARWDIYAAILRWFWIISLSSIAILYLVSGYFERYKVGSSKAKNIVKIAQSLFFIAFIFTISFWLYLSPSVALIGASSAGSNIGILFISLFFGVFLGWIINSWYNKNKRVSKNLP